MIPTCKQSKDGAPAASGELAAAAAEFLATGKLDSAVIQKLMASGKIPIALAMKIAAAKNDPEKLKEIAMELAGAQAKRQDSRHWASAGPSPGPAPGLTFVKPEVKAGEPLQAGNSFVPGCGADAARAQGDGAAGTRGSGTGADDSVDDGGPCGARGAGGFLQELAFSDQLSASLGACGGDTFAGGTSADGAYQAMPSMRLRKPTMYFQTR